MRKTFLTFLIFYFSAFLFFQEEIHSFSHHFKEINHAHTLNCIFDDGTPNEPGIAESCHFPDLFIKDSFIKFNFFSLLASQLLNTTYFYPEKVSNFQNVIFLLPLSRAPPKIS